MICARTWTAARRFAVCLGACATTPSRRRRLERRRPEPTWPPTRPPAATKRRPWTSTRPSSYSDPRYGVTSAMAEAVARDNPLADRGAIVRAGGLRHLHERQGLAFALIAAVVVAAEGLGHIPAVDAIPLLDEARERLRRTFGHADFRGLQAEVIGEVLAGRSAMAVLPTGGGKSLCYQIPALIRPGLGLVVSPLIALMADQVAALTAVRRGRRAAGFRASIRTSGATPGARIEAGELDLLYLSPEGLMQPAMLERLGELDARP